MRAGACAVQQALTSEAASVLRLSLGLARRRGHAQVTPLHVAATLLSPRASLLRRACLKSQPHQSSHPLQCRALELCFNVALNRLPTSPPGPLLHSHPSLSNALIAALKRAQAHQRRGCIEQPQPPPLLAAKVELEQLIISILDDPSVSRVMREAGFSSSCVKNNLEDVAASVPTCVSPHGKFPPCFWPPRVMNSHPEKDPVSHFPLQKPKFSTHFIEAGAVTEEEDLRLIMRVMLGKKRRNTVVVGDGLSSIEGLVLQLMEKLDRGEVPQELRSAQFVKFQLCPASLSLMKRSDVEAKLAELRRNVGAHAMDGGAVIYAGDLKWAVEDKDGGGWGCYNAMEHVIAEVGRLLSDFSSCTNGKVWLMGVANYQTYMKLQMRAPPLEVQWALQAVAVPSGGLALSLHASSGLDSGTQSESQLAESKLISAHEEQENLTFCPECNSNFEREVAAFTPTQQKPSSVLGFGNTATMEKGMNFPHWLQQHQAESHPKKVKQNGVLLELRRKWNKICLSLHQTNQSYVHTNPNLFSHGGVKSHSYATSHHLWPTTLQCKQNAFPDSNSMSLVESTLKPGSNLITLSQRRNQQSYSIEIGFGDGNYRSTVIDLDSFEKEDSMEVKTTLALGNPLFSVSKSPSDQIRATRELSDLCRELLENIYWQSETIPKIAASLLDCKSQSKNGTWMLMQGTDWIGNRRLARAVAESLYGSAKRLFHMNLKRIRENEFRSCAEIFSEALTVDPNQVIMVEEIRIADVSFIKLLASCYKEGVFVDFNGKEVSSSKATIIITTCSPMKLDEDDSKERSESTIQMELQFDENPGDAVESCDRKRSAEYLLPNNVKRLKTESEMEEPPIILDLNACAPSEDENDEEGEESNANSSDLTEESARNVFLDSIQNQFTFHWSPARIGLLFEKFMSRLNGSFHKAMGNERSDGWSLRIDQAVVKELVEAADTFLEGVFERWLEEVFQTSLATVKKGGKEGVVRLIVVEGKMGNLGSSYLGSRLPRDIQVVANHIK